MKFAKRIVLFVAVNALIITTLTVVSQLLGVGPFLTSKGLNYSSLLFFCLVWGFGGAFISLALSKVMAKWMMGVKIIEPGTSSPELQHALSKVHEYSRRAGLSKMPEVGYYESDELNAFATGPTQSRALVAVSTGLLQKMNRSEVEGVLAHEVAHIANGDMVTMTLIQGVVNVFVMFLARVLAYFATQFTSEENRGMVQFVATLIFEIGLGILGMIVVSSFSRRREFRADHGATRLAGREKMIAALERLKLNFEIAQSQNENDDEHATQPAIASLQISGKSAGPTNLLRRLFATHPELDERIARLKLMTHEHPMELPQLRHL